MKTYVTKFQWEGAKYPWKQSLKMLSEIIGKVQSVLLNQIYKFFCNLYFDFQQITQIDNDLKTKSSTYNNLKNSLASIGRKAAYVLVII